MGKKQQDSFEEIKCRLIKPPFLHMPNKTGRFHLYSITCTSKFRTGSALHQIYNGKPKLIVYVRKRLPEAAKSYFITELELCLMLTYAINFGLPFFIWYSAVPVMASFSHLLKWVDFDAIVDHLALTHIIKSQMEPVTMRIKRLLELISSYSFNFYYMTGKDMILSDFLSQQKSDDSSPNEIIPISFDMYQVLEDNSYLENVCGGKYLIQTWSQAKSSGIKLPEVHGVKKNLDPNQRPEKTPYLTQTGKFGEAAYSSGESQIKEKKTWSL